MTDRNPKSADVSNGGRYRAINDPEAVKAAGRELEETLQDELEILREPWNSMTHAQRRTDAGNAMLFAAHHKSSARYARDTKEWIVWNGSRWCRGDDVAVIGLALMTARRLSDVTRGMFGTHGSFPDEELMRFLKWAATSLSAERISAIPKLARADASLACVLADFDLDAMLLNCPNGTVDLRTGELFPHRPDDLITKITSVPYDPAAACPRFVQFLTDITEGSAALQHFLH